MYKGLLLLLLQRRSETVKEIIAEDAQSILTEDGNYIITE